MEFFDTIKERKSIRRYKNKPIEENKIRKILNAVNLAPSAGDLQAYEVVLVSSKEVKEKLTNAAYGQKSISIASIVFVFLANPKRSSVKYGERGNRLYCIQDATIASAYTQLAAADLGLSSVWIGAFDDNAVLEAINAPKNLVPVSIIPIGYPDERPKRTQRRKLDDLVHKERY